jgi:hypothetical protein
MHRCLFQRCRCTLLLLLKPLLLLVMLGCGHRPAAEKLPAGLLLLLLLALLCRLGAAC